MKKLNEISLYLKNKKQFFFSEFGVKNIVIFGSYVKGTASETSDLDIAIEMVKEKKNLHNFLRFKRLLEKELSLKVDIGIKETLKDEVKKQIVMDGIYV